MIDGRTWNGRRWKPAYFLVGLLLRAGCSLSDGPFFAGCELSLVEQQVLLRKHGVSLSLLFIKFDKIWLFSAFRGAVQREAPF